MLRILKTLAIAIFFIILALFLYPWVLRSIGYYVDNTGGEVAEIAAQKKDVSLCKKIIVYARFMGPTAGSRTRECIYTYAELTKDPSACELLMPSDYGWSCLGGVESKLYEGYGCGNTNELINCTGDIHIPNRGIENCASYQDQVVRDWCHSERTENLANTYECNLVSAEPEHARDECNHKYAYKLRDASKCSVIRNDSRRHLCEMEVKYAR